MDVLDPCRFVLISMVGWMNQQGQQAIEYLREENTVCVSNSAVVDSGLQTNNVVDWLPKHRDSDRRALAAVATIVTT